MANADEAHVHSPVTVFRRAECQPSRSSRTASLEFDKSSKKELCGQDSPCLNRQQHLDSPSYYGERRCGELRHEQRKRKFAIEPGKNRQTDYFLRSVEMSACRSTIG
jgi:hypothetical protein